MKLNNAVFFEGKIMNLNKESTKSQLYSLKQSMLKNEHIAHIYVYGKEHFDIFSIWISSLSWRRFFVFLLLTEIIGSIIISMCTNGAFHEFLDNILGCFLIGSFILKVFISSKVKSEQKVKEAQFFAEKEMLQRQLVEAKIQVMQAQIEPHFLFNTLSSLQYLIETDQKKANKMLMSLVTYLRYALPEIRENQAFNTLGKEIANIHAYLSIMEIRMGDRLNLQYNISSLLNDIKFPAMMLQPIVENAIKYGIEESIEGGTITISAKYIDDMLEVSVADTGMGLNANKPKGGNGMALNNIKTRLEMLYDHKAKLIIMNNEPKGVIVKIQIPA